MRRPLYYTTVPDLIVKLDNDNFTVIIDYSNFYLSEDYLSENKSIDIG